MAITGSNDLNALLQAKVIQIRVELDYKNSDLSGQIKKISEYLANKPVKLKIKFDMTVSDLNTELKTLSTKLSESKTIKPIKIGVEIDVAGTATKIKDQLKQINTIVQDFNKQYASQIKEMQKLTEQIGGSGGKGASNPLEGNISSYINSLGEVENYMRNKFGQNGLFSSTVFKDAEGQISGFIGQLEKANGVVDKIKYEWSADAEAFSPINETTITTMQKTVAKAKSVLDSLYTDIAKLNDGAGRNGLEKYFSDLQTRADHMTLNMGNVEDLKNQIKIEAQLQSQVKSTNNMYTAQADLIRRITTSMNQAWKVSKNMDVRTQYKNLLMDVQTTPENQMMASGWTAQEAELRKINGEMSVYNKEQATALANARQLSSVMTQLNTIQRQTPSNDVTSNNLISEIKLMTTRAKSGEEWLAIQQKMNQLKSSNANSVEMQKSLDIENKIMDGWKKLQELGGMTNEEVSKELDALVNNVGTRFADLQVYYKELLRNIQNAQQAEKELADQNKITLAEGGSSQALHVQSMVNAQDIEGLQRYFSTLYGGKVATVQMKDATDSMGRSIAEIKVKMDESGKSVTAYTLQMQRSNAQLTQTSAGMEYNANRNLGVMEQLKVAMSRVPVWMVAMTAFYGTINQLKQWSAEIVKVDSELTEIRRVANSNINLDTLFAGAVQLSNQLGNNLDDVLNTIGDFARTFGDFNEQQLLAITNTATLMSNVSDMSVQDAGNNLVATMKAFNIQASDSIHIVDALNQVDNDYAISTQQLAEGLTRSASTAKTFGATMEETIGYITAIGAVTMESGSVIGNSLKTIFSRITTMAPAKKALADIGVAIQTIGKDGVASVRPVDQVLGDIAVRWDKLSASQQQNVAVQVAGRYQLTRFLALMNNWQDAVKATTTAYNSQGSAMREQERYMQSYQARINVMKNSFETLGLSMGKAFLDNGLTLGITLFTQFAQSITNFVTRFGALPAIFLGIGLIATKMGFFKTMTTWVEGATTAFMRFGTSIKANGWSQSVNDMATAFKNLNGNAEIAKTAVQSAQEAVQAQTLKVVEARNEQDVANQMVIDSTHALAIAEQELSMAVDEEAQSVARLNIVQAESELQDAQEIATTQARIVNQQELNLATQQTALGMAEASASATGLGLALKGALVSTGIGAIFVGIGMGLQFLLNKYAEYKQTQEQVAKATKDEIDAFHQAGNSYDGLINTYEKLNTEYQKMGENMPTKDLQQYQTVQNQLAKDMPNVVDYVDANGQAHLKSADAIRQEAKDVANLAKAQAQLDLTKQTDSINKQTDSWNSNRKALDDLIAKRNDMKKNGSSTQVYDSSTDSYVTIQKTSEQTKQDIAELNVEITKQQSTMTDSYQKTIKNVQAQTTAYLTSKGVLVNLGDAQQRVLDDFVQNNHAMLEGAKNTNQYNKAQQELIQGGNDLGMMFSDTFNKMSKGIGNNPQKLQAIKDELNSVAQALPPNFLVIDPKAGRSLDDVKRNLQDVLDVAGKIKDGSVDVKSLTSELENAGMSSKDATGYVYNLAKSLGNASIQSQLASSQVDGMTASIDSLAQATINAIDPIQTLFGIDKNALSGLQSNVQELQLLQEAYGKNASKTDVWNTSMKNLTDYLGVSADQVKNNLPHYAQMLDAITKLQVTTDKYGNTILDYSGLTKNEIPIVKEAIKELGGNYDIVSLLTGQMPKATDAQAKNTKATKDNTQAKKDSVKASDPYKTALEKEKQANDNLKSSAEQAKQKVEDMHSSIPLKENPLANKLDLFKPVYDSANKANKKIDDMKKNAEKPPTPPIDPFKGAIGSVANMNSAVKNVKNQMNFLGNPLFNPIGTSAKNNKKPVDDLKNSVSIIVKKPTLPNPFGYVGQSATTNKTPVDKLHDSIVKITNPILPKNPMPFNTIGINADANKKKVDTLVKTIILKKPALPLNPFNSIGNNAMQNTKPVQNLANQIKNMPKNPLPSSVFNPLGTSADKTAKKVQNVSSSVDTIIKKKPDLSQNPFSIWQSGADKASSSIDAMHKKASDTTATKNAKKAISDLESQIKQASSSEKVLGTIQSQIGSVTDKAIGLVNNLKTIGGLADNVTNKTGSLDKLANDVTVILKGFQTLNAQAVGIFAGINAQAIVLAPSVINLSNTIANIGVSSVGANNSVETLIVSVKSLADVKFDNATNIGVKYAQLSSTVYNCILAINKAIGNYNSALVQMESNTKVELSKIENDFSVADKVIVGKVNDMANAMKKAFENGTNSIVKNAGDLPSQIGEAIKKNMGASSSAIQSLADDMVSRFKKALGIHSPSKVFTELGGWVIKGLESGLSNHNLTELGQNVFSDFGGGVFDSLDMIKAYLGGGAGFNGGAGSEAVKGWLMSAIGKTGAPVSWLPALEQMAMSESGGNPSAVNLWDSNAKAGHPSMGLMQTIQPTFNAYSMKGYGDILNPIDNAIASIRYILDTYGSIFNTPGMRSMASGGGYKGYATGGIVDTPELAWHGEDGAEAIIPLTAKYRGRGLELWTEASQRLGIPAQTIEWLKTFLGKSGSGQATGGAGSFGASSGDGGGEGGGSDSGTSGTIVAPTPRIVGSYDIYGDYTMSALSSSSSLADPYLTNSYQNTENANDTQVTLLTNKQNNLVKASVQYRDILKQIISLENSRQSTMQSELNSLNARNSAINRQLASLPALNKQTSAQRDTYNSLHQELDQNTQRIQTIQTDMSAMVNTIHQQSVEIFTNFIDEITGKFDTAISSIQQKADNTDFNIQVLQVANPNDKKDLLNLQAQKASELQSVQSTTYNKMNDIQSQYNSAVKNYGSTSDQANYVKQQLDQVVKDYQQATLAVVQAEQDLSNTRGQIADDSINQLKTYYQNMESMATDAIDKEKTDLQKAHDAKMQMYSDETDAINNLYDAKTKEIDQAQADSQYASDLADKTKAVTDLQNKIALLSRDTSLEGKKSLADLQTQLSSAQKDLASTQQQHQVDTEKQALATQQQQQLDAITVKQNTENTSFQSQSDALDAQKTQVTQQYEDLINNDQKWAKMRDDATKGNFSTINTELQKMADNVNAMNKGIFDGLVAGFGNYSSTVKQQIADANKIMVSNMAYNQQQPISEASQASQATIANSYKPTGGVVQGSTATSVSNPYENTPTSSSRPVSTSTTHTSSTSSKGKGTIVITADVWMHKTPDTKTSSRVKLLKKGTEWKYYGETKAMYDIGGGYVDASYAKVVTGSSSSPSHGYKTTSAVNFRSSAGYGSNVIEAIPKGATVTYDGMVNGWAKVTYGGRTGYIGEQFLQKFDTGGYTGDWSDNGGKVAVLHKKELVLNAQQTQNILDTAKIMDKIKGVLPQISAHVGSVASKIATASTITTNITYGDIIVNVQDGNKKKSSDIAKEILTGIKKKG